MADNFSADTAARLAGPAWGSMLRSDIGRIKLVISRPFSCLPFCITHMELKPQNRKWEGTACSSQGGSSPHSMALVVTRRTSRLWRCIV
jgi:hypothetical protein